MTEGIVGTIPCEMFGGPLDGAKYGDLPDLGGPYTNCELRCPLGQPAERHPRAIYVCRGEAPVHGFWQFFYERTEYPAAPKVAEVQAPDRIGWDAGIQVALARSLATIAHKGQSDKTGAPYLTHAARVASRFDPVERPLEHCAAWLHDVIEDTVLGAADLTAAGVYPDIVDVVVLLTRSPGMLKSEYYRGIAASPIARAVKHADIDDNTDARRTQHLDPATRAQLAAKYADARRAIDCVSEVTL